MIILHETQAFSPIDVFKSYSRCTAVQIEVHENYQKRSLRNKYHIQTSQGVQALTIPLKSGKNYRMPIQEVRISYDENWIKLHIHAIKSAYGKSPFFEFYFDHIENHFHQEYTFLYEFNSKALHLLFSLLKINIPVCESRFYEINTGEGILDFRGFSWPYPILKKTENLFYLQVWSPPGFFCEHLSILDTLFCAGPNALASTSET